MQGPPLQHVEYTVHVEYTGHRSIAISIVQYALYRAPTQQVLLYIEL